MKFFEQNFDFHILSSTQRTFVLENTSVISSLAKIRELKLLKEFSDVWTTASVVEEVVDSEISSIVESLSRALSDWLEVSTVVDIDSIRDIQKHHPSL